LRLVINTKIAIQELRLTNVIPDNWVMIVEGAHKTIVLIRNWIEIPNGNIFLLGCRFTKQEDLFLYPFFLSMPSSFIDEFVVSSLSNVLESFSLPSVKYKCVCLPTTFPANWFVCSTDWYALRLTSNVLQAMWKVCSFPNSQNPFKNV
jgi:hypothetical protein